MSVLVGMELLLLFACFNQAMSNLDVEILRHPTGMIVLSSAMSSHISIIHDCRNPKSIIAPGHGEGWARQNKEDKHGYKQLPI